jgi:uncharacterized cupin superfamily protein
MSDPNYFTFAADAELQPYDFPTEDVLGGDPRPRGISITHTAPSGVKVVTGLFALDPGKIRAEVLATETVHVLEGEMHVTFDSGEEFDAKAGDVLLFPAGTTTIREIKSPYKEMYVHSR